MVLNYHQSYTVVMGGAKKTLRINKELTAGDNIYECLVADHDGTKWDLRLIAKSELRDIFALKKREKLEVV